MACTKVIRCDEIVQSIAIAPDGQLLAAGLNGNGVLLLEAGSGERRTRLAEWHTELADVFSLLVHSVAFAPASSASQPLLLAAGFLDNTVRTWNSSSGVCVAELQGHLGAALCVAFSPNGRLLASASSDFTVRLWRTDDWRAPPAVLRGHADAVSGVSFSCDGRLLVSCSLDRTVKLWHIHNKPPAAVAVAVAAAGPSLNVGQLALCVAFSPVDSTLLACCGWEGFLVLARVVAGDGDGDGGGGGDGAITVERKLQGHTNMLVLSLAFSPCGQKLASGSRDKTVRLWSVASGACLRVLQGHKLDVFTVAFFPDGRQLASGSSDNTVRIWALSWSDQSHRHFSTRLKTAIFTLMCVRARLEEQGGLLPRLPMEVWLLVFGQLHLALDAKAGCI